MQNAINLQLMKNGPEGLDTVPFWTKHGWLYVRSDNGGDTWALLIAETGEHFDSYNEKLSNASIESIFQFVEKRLVCNVKLCLC